MPVSKLNTAMPTPRPASAVQARRNASISHQQKIELLRHYELIGYRIAYFLLNDEKLAQHAVALTLHELYEHEVVFTIAAAEQEKLVQKCFQRHAIRLHLTIL